MWFKVDDKLHDHKKTRGADCAVMGLWVLAGSWCGDNGTDGFVPASVPARWTRQWKRLADELVRRGMWETASDGDEAGWRFVNWSDWQPKRTEVELPLERIRWRRRQALKKNRQLCEEVVERDQGRCRYCSVRVNFMDRKGPAGGTYDHIDPAGDNTLDNVVVACRRCNGRKRDRTPVEAGMSLLPVPSSTDLAPAGARSSGSSDSPVLETVRNQVGTGSGLDGSGRPGSRSEPDPVHLSNGHRGEAS